MWNNIRALLIAMHMAIVLVAAAPAPVGLTRKGLDEPSLEMSLQLWADLVGKLGWDLGLDGTKDLAYRLGTDVLGFRRKLLKPAKPYFRHLGTDQSWRMFGYLNRRPARLEVAISEGEDWRDVFVARSSDATWRRKQLDQERMRTIVNTYSWRTRIKDYKRLSAWLSARALEDFPNATKVRVRMVYMRLPKPAALREAGAVPLGKSFWDQEITRGEP